MLTNNAVAKMTHRITVAMIFKRDKLPATALRRASAPIIIFRGLADIARAGTWRKGDYFRAEDFAGRAPTYDYAFS